MQIYFFTASFNHIYQGCHDDDAFNARTKVLWRYTAVEKLCLTIQLSLKFLQFNAKNGSKVLFLK